MGSNPWARARRCESSQLALAMAIANNPKLLIADEPTTALDVTLQKQILDTLVDLKNNLSMSMILISHDINLVKKYCDHMKNCIDYIKTQKYETIKSSIIYYSASKPTTNTRPHSQNINKP